MWVDGQRAAMSHSELLQTLNLTGGHMDKNGILIPTMGSKVLCKLV
jgi:hypothetical protein